MLDGYERAYWRIVLYGEKVVSVLSFFLETFFARQVQKNLIFTSLYFLDTNYMKFSKTNDSQ